MEGMAPLLCSHDDGWSVESDVLCSTKTLRRNVLSRDSGLAVKGSFVLQWVLAGFAVVGSLGCGSGGSSRISGAIPHGRPVVGDAFVVTSAFGVRRGRSFHQGIDLSAPKGAPVLATGDGRVSFAGRLGDFGRLVVIDHGSGWHTRYAHLKKIKVDLKDRVKKGTVVGTVGKSGNATGYHLHYEVIHNGERIDPATTF